MFSIICMIVVLRTALTLRRECSMIEATDGEQMEGDFAVATFNIENAVKFSRLKKEGKKYSNQLNHLFGQLAKSSVIFLQEYTDVEAYKALLPTFGENGEHFALIDPYRVPLMDSGLYESDKENAFRVAILYDTRHWVLNSANTFVLTKVDKLGLAERQITHIKNRVALYASLSPIDRPFLEYPDEEVNFINIHLDAVHTASHPTHHHEQLSRLLLDWIRLKIKSTSEKVIGGVISSLKLVIGGDTNYRGGADELLLKNLIKGQGKNMPLHFAALGLRDALLNATPVSTQSPAHLHEKDFAKKSARFVARVRGPKEGALAPKRLDLLATNLVAYGQNVVAASSISDHHAVIGYFNTALYRRAPRQIRAGLARGSRV